MARRKWKSQAHQPRVRCPHCGRDLPKSRLKGHLRKLPCSLAAEAARGKVDRDDEEPRPTLYLISKRGTRVFEGGTCDECRDEAKRLWRYSKSNVGVVHICARCKPRVFDRSHGRVDAWSTVVDKKKAPPERRR